MRPKDFKVGKWYHCREWNNSNDYVKLLKLADNYHGIRFKEYISGGHYYKVDGYSYDSEWFVTLNEMEEVPLSELKKYLPKGHPDLKKNNINNKS